MLEKELQEIGLNEKEAKVYLASLELGQSTVQKISQKAGVNRATAYFIIESLARKGLVSSFHQNKKQFFIAADPNRLSELLEQQKENIKKNEKKLKELLPQLQSMDAKQKNRPVVKYYEGKEGLISIQEEFLKSRKGIASMAYSVDAVNRVFTNNEMSRFRRKRLNKDIKNKVIYTYKKGILESDKTSKRKKVPFSKFPITCDIAIYDNKIRLASLGKRLTGIIIEDKELADSMKAIFNLAWEAAEKYQK
ncbi:hypothetical protein J7J13_01250 [bacterium]|nr:hypothetical protein [bacterium]